MFNKKFRNQHPYPFIALACLFESMFYQINSYYDFLCLANFPTLLAITRWIPRILSGNISYEDSISPNMVYHSLTIDMIMEKYLYVLAIIMSLVINSILLIDLYLSLTNPFYPTSKRIKWYYTLMLIVFIAFSISFLFFDPMSPTFEDTGSYNFNMVYAGVCSLFGLITLVFTFLVVIRLKQKGTSPELK